MSLGVYLYYAVNIPEYFLRLNEKILREIQIENGQNPCKKSMKK